MRESPPKAKGFVLEALLKRINTKKPEVKSAWGIKGIFCVRSIKCHNPNKIP